MGSEIIEAFVHVVQLMPESFSLTGGHHLVHLSVQGPTKDTSVWAVAGLGRWGVSLFSGSVNKLIDFISGSHSSLKPYCPYGIYMLTVERVTFPNFYVFLLLYFLTLPETSFIFCL